MTNRRSLATECARLSADQPALQTPPIAPPIHQTAVFDVGDLETLAAIQGGDRTSYSYSRDGNPTIRLFEQAVAHLEDAAAAVATGSGMAAAAACCFGLLRPGDRVVAADVLYGQTSRLLLQELGAFGVTTSFVDIHDLAAVRSALDQPTKLLLVETISNPLLRVADLPNVGQIAATAGTLPVVDNTFATPVLCQPLKLGAALVFHSGTKYFGGHSDVTCGAVAGDQATIDRVREFVATLGLVLGPFDAWLTIRGLKTLPLRFERASANAFAIARALQGAGGVLNVHYPGLPEHPDHELAGWLFDGWDGAMVSFEIAGGRVGVQRFIQRLTAIPFAPSLGDFATTLSHPASTSHRVLPAAERARLGICDGLIRLSVGVEDLADLLDEIRQALAG